TQGNVAWTGSTEPRQTAPTEFDQRHKLVGVFDFRFAKNEGPRIGSAYPLQNFGFNVLLQAASGLPYTPIEPVNEVTLGAFAPEPRDVRNSESGPWTTYVDLKFEKSLTFGKVSLAPYVWIKNLFDRDNAVAVWEFSGRPNSSGWLETPEGQQFVANYDEVDDTSGLTGGEKFEIAQFNPQNYSNPRMIFFGMRASF
ncbi:MAG: hypothetical protein ACRD5H_11740, partial [Nitrososphaerales archaeon]